MATTEYHLCELDNPESFDTSEIPPRVLDALNNYAWTGRPVGGFVYAVLQNNLRGAIFRADPDSLAALRPICQYVYNVLPSKIHGSEVEVEKHLKRGAELKERIH